MSVRRLIYFSRAVGTVTQSEIRHILAVSRERNAAAGITGLLIHLDGVFAQVLEGSCPAVGETIHRICDDPRHHEISVLADGDVDRRAFDDWSMAYLEADVCALLESAGLPDVEAALAAFADRDPSPGDPVIDTALASLSQRVTGGGVRPSSS